MHSAAWIVSVLHCWITDLIIEDVRFVETVLDFLKCLFTSSGQRDGIFDDFISQKLWPVTLLPQSLHCVI